VGQELTILAYILPPRAIISRASLSVEDQIKALKEGPRTLQAPSNFYLFKWRIIVLFSGGIARLTVPDMQDRFCWAVLGTNLAARTRILVQP
jgi:hypothetical protein